MFKLLETPVVQLSGERSLPELMIDRNSNTPYGATRPQWAESIAFTQLYVNDIRVINFVLTHWGRDKIAAILQTTIFNTFSRMKMYESSLKWMAWCRPGHKPLSEPMVVRLLTHICVTQYIRKQATCTVSIPLDIFLSDSRNMRNQYKQLGRFYLDLLWFSVMAAQVTTVQWLWMSFYSHVFNMK